MGINPDEIEATWSLDTINRVLFVYRAQQEARIAIASINKVSLSDVYTPTSLELRRDEAD